MIVTGRLICLSAYYRPEHPLLALTGSQLDEVREFNRLVRRSAIAFESIDCLCGSSAFEQVAGVDRYGMLQSTVICTRCGLLQSNPRMTDDAYRNFYESDRYRRIYDGTAFVDSYESCYTDGRSQELYEHVMAHRRAGAVASVLEFGAGGGWNLGQFVAAGVPRVVGYDYSAALVSLGKSRGLDLVQGGIEQVEGRFDVILLQNVIEHFTDVAGALKRLRDCLAPDGMMFVEVPDVMAFGMGQLQNAHTYYFTRRTLEFCASQASLAMVATGPSPTKAGHMWGVFTATSADPFGSEFLAGHYREMADMLRRHERVYRARTPLRALGRVLDAVGLGRPIRRLVDAADAS